MALGKDRSVHKVANKRKPRVERGALDQSLRLTAGTRGAVGSVRGRKRGDRGTVTVVVVGGWGRFRGSELDEDRILIQVDIVTPLLPVPAIGSQDPNPKCFAGFRIEKTITIELKILLCGEIDGGRSDGSRLGACEPWRRRCLMRPGAGPCRAAWTST